MLTTLWAQRWHRAVVLSALFLFPSLVFAQTGIIAGTVVEESTGETLPGVNVVIDGTTQGASTSLDGDYRIASVSPGTYTLVFTYIGFTTQRVTGVEVTAGEVTTIDLAMGEEPLDLGDGQEVVVEARAIRNNEATLLRDRARAVQVSDAISAEAISRSGAGDAADAMEKVVGASVVGGQYVYVRGLGERYANTQLNGSNLPSSDPDRKAVQFDLFPSSLLENIVTLKTFTPDKPGDFSGGLVDISTKSFPEQLTFSLSTSTSFNSETLGSDYLTYAGGGSDWLGFDDGTRALPDVFVNPDPDMPIPQRGPTTNDLRNTDQARDYANAALLYYGGETFNGQFQPATGSQPINQSYSLTFGNQNQVFGNPLGYVISGTYGFEGKAYDGGVENQYSFASPGDLAPDFLLTSARGQERVDIGLIANASYRLGPNNEFSLNTLYTRTGEQDARFLSGGWPKEFGANDSTSIYATRVLGYKERDLLTSQLRGEHVLPSLFNTRVEWSGSLSNTRQEEPDLRFFTNTERLIGTDTVLTVQASGFRQPTRLFRDLEESNASAKLDITVPLRLLTTQNSQIKFGGLVERGDRSFEERFFEYVVASPELIPFEGDPDAFLSQENVGLLDSTGTGFFRYSYGHIIRDASRTENFYDGTREVVAGYLMAELPITERLRVITGARVESSLLETRSQGFDFFDVLDENGDPVVNENGDVVQDSTRLGGTIDELDLLPSLNVVYSLSDNMNVRAAATRTLARPTLREFSPATSFDFAGGYLLLGNTDLDRTLINNYDLRWEWFTRPGEILAVSAFYKYMQDPIERAVVGGTNGQVQYQNVPSATVQGLEFELRSRLDRLAAPLANFSVGLNLTLTDSNIDIPEQELVARQRSRCTQEELDGGTCDVETQRELQGQSPYIVNADLGYQNFESATAASLLFNVFGSRLSNVGFAGVPDIFEQPSPQLDFTFSQGFFDDTVRVKVGVKNILNADYEEAYEFEGETIPFTRFNLGRSYSFGVTYSL